MFLEIKGIKKSFGAGESHVDVLKGIDLEIEKGEFCVLLGPSGSGKSTLLNIIGGIDGADAGSITIQGEQLEDMNEKKLSLYRRKHLGYIFQMYNLIPNLTVRENIEVGAYLSDRPLDVDELLETLGLYEHQRKLPNQLSGGQQQGAHRQLLHGIGVGAGGIEYHDARLGAAVDGDVISARARPGHGPQGIGECIVVHVRRADQNTVLVFHIGADGVAGLVQYGQPGGGNLIQCLDAIHIALSPSLFLSNAWMKLHAFHGSP